MLAVAVIILLFGVLFVAEALYVRLAHRLGIGVVRDVDGCETFVPVGGGVVFALAAIAAVFLAPWHTIWFLAAVAGGVALAALSFVDDLVKLSPRLRLVVQAIVLATVLYPLLAAGHVAVYLLAVLACVGYLNTSNFMDGSNGMLAGYSGVVLASLVFAACAVMPSSDCDVALPSVGSIRVLCSCLLVAAAVFAMFNFRSRAVVFSGDVGSIAVGYFIAFSLTVLIVRYGRVSMAVFVIVFLVDTFCTFVQRLFNGENVLSPHKKHLYQIFLREGYPQLSVAAAYAMVQFAINALWFVVPPAWQNTYALAVAVLVCAAYLVLKSKMTSSSKIKYLK